MALMDRINKRFRWMEEALQGMHYADPAGASDASMQEQDEAQHAEDLRLYNRLRSVAMENEGMHDPYLACASHSDMHMRDNVSPSDAERRRPQPTSGSKRIRPGTPEVYRASGSSRRRSTEQERSADARRAISASPATSLYETSEDL